MPLLSDWEHRRGEASRRTLSPLGDEAVGEIVAAFEQKSDKQVELVFRQQDERPQKIVAALEAGKAARFRLRHWDC
jgi:hypothetical protein